MPFIPDASIGYCYINQESAHIQIIFFPSTGVCRAKNEPVAGEDAKGGRTERTSGHLQGLSPYQRLHSEHNGGGEDIGKRRASLSAKRCGCGGRSCCHRLGKRNATSRGQSHGSGGPKGVLSKGRDSSKWRQGSDNTKKWSGGIPDAFPSGKRAEDYRRPGRYRNRRHLLPGAEGDQEESELISFLSKRSSPANSFTLSARSGALIEILSIPWNISSLARPPTISS